MTERTESRYPGSTQNTALGQAPVKRDELIELHKHYEAAAKDERDFFFRYLNFYIGLLSAILAATLTGVLGLSEPSLNPLLKLPLLIGPILTIILSYVGYRTLKVCYRRFLESWVTSINIRAMLGFTGRITLDKGIRQPIYKGQYDNGFIAEFENEAVTPLKKLNKAAEEGKFSEEVLEDLLKEGQSLSNAKITFAAFGVAAIILSVVVTIAVLLPI